MTAFTNTFTQGPIGSEAANGLDVYIRSDNKNALEERYAIEHISLRSGEVGATDSSNSNAQGRHKPGIVGVMGYGTQAEMDALLNMGNGALFLNTTTGYFYHYQSDTGWSVVPIAYTGVIASDAEAVAGTVENKAINPKQLKVLRTEIEASPKIKAWADYNGDTSTLNANFNIASVVKNSTGNYTFTFTTPMANTNYCVVFGQSFESAGTLVNANPWIGTKLTTSLTVLVQGKSTSGVTEADATILNFSIIA